MGFCSVIKLIPTHGVKDRKCEGLGFIQRHAPLYKIKRTNDINEAKHHIRHALLYKIKKINDINEAKHHMPKGPFGIVLLLFLTLYSAQVVLRLSCAEIMLCKTYFQTSF